MKRKIVSLATSLPVILCYVVLLLFSITHLGCNESGDKKGMVSSLTLAKPCADSDWLLLNIRFKQNVDIETREACLKAIEKAIIDTIIVIKNTRYQTYNPSILLKKYPFEDSISYQFKISGGSDRALSITRTDTTLGPGSDVPCYCPTCGICRKVKSISIPTGLSQTPTLLSDLLDLVETPYVK